MLALGAAILFGASVPATKWVGASIDPILLAGLLYLGSGLGLTLWIFGAYANNPGKRPTIRVRNAKEGYYLGGAIFFGGILAPVLLMIGLRRTPSSTASLLLNSETAFTVALACLIFKETYGKRLILGFVLLLAGGAFLAMSDKSRLSGNLAGVLAIAGACVGWAIDNNLTKQVTSLDAPFLAALKGIVAGTVNIGLALGLGMRIPELRSTLATMGIGFLGYGLSLVLFILSLRKIGAARTSAYFSTAPFVGAVISIFLLNEPFVWPLGVAGFLMALGVYLHLTESPSHKHTHDFLEHDHEHIHDVHHQHQHSPVDPPGEPHSHPHQHEPLVHSHPHEHDDFHHNHGH